MSVLSITNGNTYEVSGREVVLQTVINLQRCVVLDPATGELEITKTSKLRAVTKPNEGLTAKRQDVSKYTDEQWSEAKARLELIEPLLNQRRRSRADVEERSEEVNSSPATLYRYLRRYRELGLFGLVDGRTDRTDVTFRLDDRVEQVIADVIGEKYKTVEAPRPAAVIEEVHRRCHVLGLRKPAANTVRDRIDRERGRGTSRVRRERRDEEQFTASPSSLPNNKTNLGIYQIDHTPMDVAIVDDEGREFSGRPYLTMAIDTSDRMVGGVFVSLDPPSVQSVALCVHNAIFPKDQYLEELGVEGEWPVWGIPDSIHCDNGPDFRAEAVQKGCDFNGIDLTWRPVKRAKWGGHIERLLGTANGKLVQFPGKIETPDRRKVRYNSEKRAIFTMREIEELLVHWIVNIYQKQRHRGLGGRVPFAVHQELLLGAENTVGRGIPDVPQNAQRMLCDFLPIEYRTVQQYGVQIMNVRFYGPEIERFVGQRNPHTDDGRYIIRLDRRKASPVYLYDHEQRDYIELHFANLGRSNCSWWEIEEANRRLREQGLRDYDEDAVFRAMEDMERRKARSQKKTKQARKEQQKKVARAQSVDRTEALRTNAASAPLPAPGDDGLLDDLNIDDLDLGAIETLSD
ncbi:transposon transposition protein B [Oceanococcus atlanticus]|uniref:Transposon transposition protein B n=1 Tax=Oceanococcus atlanticus TaxID=1317117 RepID=A0A1Y1SJB9_9GAMM|nr:Mu transposase C-terminal domain-containing protein [Oceanococcus atlanticus]ORE89470.1 transposon transposition protein B [Oceanococcus atlanticus]